MPQSHPSHMDICGHPMGTSGCQWGHLGPTPWGRLGDASVPSHGDVWMTVGTEQRGPIPWGCWGPILCQQIGDIGDICVHPMGTPGCHWGSLGPIPWGHLGDASVPSIPHGHLGPSHGDTWVPMGTSASIPWGRLGANGDICIHPMGTSGCQWGHLRPSHGDTWVTPRSHPTWTSGSHPMGTPG